MKHKLWVELQFSYPKKYKKFLSESEIPRGVTTEVKVILHNISGATFPGGMLNEISSTSEGSGRGLKTYNEPKKVIKKIEKNETQQIFTWNTQFRLSGLVWVACDIKSNNSEDAIDFFQHQELEPDELPLKQYKDAFTVIDKEPLEIQIQLNEIKGKLDELIRKEH